MRTKRLLTALLLVLSASVPVTALAKSVDVYDCSFSTTRPFMSEKLMFIHDEDAGEYLVLDGMIHQVEGRPMLANVNLDDAKRLKLSWQVLFTDYSGKSGRLNYGLSFDKRNARVVVSMNAGTYENREWVRGRCRKSTQDF